MQHFLVAGALLSLRHHPWRRFGANTPPPNGELAMRHVLSSAIILVTMIAAPLDATAQQWRNTVSRDEMTGEVSAYAISPSASPTRPMAFPYNDVTGFLAFGCNGNSEWAYIGFSEEPNLTNQSIQDGYSSFRMRIKWDDEIETVQMTQPWGSRFLHFRSYAPAIAKMISSNTVLVELDWYGSGKTYFRFSLAGSSNAIARARASCRGD